MRAGNEPLHRTAAISLAAEHIQQHAVGDLETGLQALGLGAYQARKSVLVPVDEVPLRRLAFNDLLSVARGFAFEFEILNHVFGGLRHHPAAVIKALAPGSAANLVKVARAEDGRLLAIELAQSREKHRADRHIDPDTEGVRAADNLEQTFLGELLHQHAVFRQQACMVQANPVLQPFADFGPIRAGKLESFNGVA